MKETIKRYKKEIEEEWVFYELEDERNISNCAHFYRPIDELFWRDKYDIHPIFDTIYGKEIECKIQKERNTIIFDGSYGRFVLKKIDIPEIPLLSYLIKPEEIKKIREGFDKFIILSPFHQLILITAMNFANTNKNEIKQLLYVNINQLENLGQSEEFKIQIYNKGIKVIDKEKEIINFSHQPTKNFFFDGRINRFLAEEWEGLINILQKRIVSGKDLSLDEEHELDEINQEVWDIIYENYGLSALEALRYSMDNLHYFVLHFDKDSQVMIERLLSKDKITKESLFETLKKKDQEK